MLPHVTTEAYSWADPVEAFFRFQNRGGKRTFHGSYQHDDCDWIVIMDDESTIIGCMTGLCPHQSIPESFPCPWTTINRKESIIGKPAMELNPHH